MEIIKYLIFVLFFSLPEILILILKLTSIRITHYYKLVGLSWFYTLIKIFILYGMIENFFIRILLIIIMCIYVYFIIKNFMIKNIIQSILSSNYNYTKNIFIVALIIDTIFFITLYFYNNC